MSPIVANLSGYAIVLILAIVIKNILASKESFTDFIKGDDGKYSLSRLQATLWAFVIISYQISTLVTVMSLGNYTAFKLVFSDETLWLLGLSMGGYITVKGITVNQENAKPNLAVQSLKDSKVVAQWSDLISSDEGLDLSRFQMLIWTLIALVTFMVSSANYVDGILASGGNEEILRGFFNEFTDPVGKTPGKLPTVDMSFIVLMGLSQGTYIGRKLVPAYKVDSFTKEYLADLQSRKTLLDTAITFHKNEYQLILDSPQTSVDQRMRVMKELEDLKTQEQKIQDEISSLTKSSA